MLDQENSNFLHIYMYIARIKKNQTKRMEKSQTNSVTDNLHLIGKKINI